MKYVMLQYDKHDWSTTASTLCSNTRWFVYARPELKLIFENIYSYMNIKSFIHDAAAYCILVLQSRRTEHEWVILHRMKTKRWRWMNECVCVFFCRCVYLIDNFIQNWKKSEIEKKTNKIFDKKKEEETSERVLSLFLVRSEKVQCKFYRFCSWVMPHRCRDATEIRIQPFPSLRCVQVCVRIARCTQMADDDVYQALCPLRTHAHSKCILHT